MNSVLFSQLKLRSLEVRNRVMVSPIAQYCAEDGAPTEWHLVHLGKFAMGGAGIVFVEATKVERRGLGTVGDTGLWADHHVPPFKQIA